MDLSATPMPTKIEVKKVVEAEICESSPTPTEDGKRSNKSTRPSSGKGRKSVTQSLEEKSSAKENEEKLTAKKVLNIFKIYFHDLFLVDQIFKTEFSEEN